MEDKVSGERKKLSLSSGGKLTLKNSINSNKSPNSITANSRVARGTVQVEVKRTKRISNRSNLNENVSYENSSGLSAQEIKKYYPELIDLAPFDSIFDRKLGKKVSKSGDEYLTLNYERLVPILLQGIKELNANNKAIEEKNKILEDKYNSLEKELQEIRKLLDK